MVVSLKNCEGTFCGSKQCNDQARNDTQRAALPGSSGCLLETLGCHKIPATTELHSLDAWMQKLKMPEHHHCWIKQVRVWASVFKQSTTSKKAEPANQSNRKASVDKKTVAVCKQSEGKKGVKIPCSTERWQNQRWQLS